MQTLRTNTVLARGLLLAAFTLAGACHFNTDEPYLAGGELVPLYVHSSDPANGVTDVERNGALVVFFSDRVDPATVDATTVALSAGAEGVASTSRADLLDCSVVVRPSATLEPLTEHRLAITSLRGLSTGELSAPASLLFTTGQVTDDATAGVPPTLTELTSEVFATRCVSCHGPYRPSADLDLSTPETAEQGLIGVPSKYRPAHTLVVAGDHARSYLMRKLLWLPGIFGDPMPPSGDWPMDRHCRTPDRDLRRVAAWIDGLLPQ
ncbi:MAG: Ig-like domain-containing protein [bacterium]